MVIICGSGKTSRIAEHLRNQVNVIIFIACTGSEVCYCADCLFVYKF